MNPASKFPNLVSASYGKDEDDEPRGQVTTVWASGEVVRTNPNGAQQQRPSVPPVKREESR